jgi:hypothetical protein
MAVSAIEPPEREPDTEPQGINSLTAAESAMAERKAGQSITTLGNDAYPQVGLIGALGWVLARRHETRLTYEAYMTSHKVDQIARELGLVDDDSDADEDDNDEDPKDSGDYV